MHFRKKLLREASAIADQVEGVTISTISQDAIVLKSPDDPRSEHFVEKDGVRFAGTHLIIDLWQAQRLDDIAFIEGTLIAAVQASGATLLHIDLHHFTDNNGVSGVATLAESHMSIHTWPECEYAALDIFMCGTVDPYKALKIIKEAFGPRETQIQEIRRGVLV